MKTDKEEKQASQQNDDEQKPRRTMLRFEREGFVIPVWGILTIEKDFEIDVSQIAPADYIMQIVAFEPDNLGNQIRHDFVPLAVSFTIYNANQLNNFEWNHKAWGNHVLPTATELK